MSIEDKVEVERKWRLLGSDYALDHGEPMKVAQAYLITSPGELRIRRIDDWLHFLTVKGDGSISRDEWETDIPDWVFNQLLASSAGSIEKERMRVKFEGLEVEWDIFHGSLEGLQLVEAEWVGPKENEAALRAKAAAFNLPEHLFAPYHEVTDDPRYKNKNLALSGNIPPLED